MTRETRWLDPRSVTVPTELREKLSGHPLLSETLVRRGITDADVARRFLDPAYYTPASAYDLPDMEKAVNRLKRAIEQKEHICVWGDFDVDGQTATALLVSSLRVLGATVSYYIPHRQDEGHGLHIPRLKSLMDDGAQLILTCDTGIAEHEAVNYANGRGVDVVITDHHQLPPELPGAHAAVNPQRLPKGHPLRTLPGVGCAYKVIQALYEACGKPGQTEHLLDLVALGIVADVAEVVADTRYLLQLGLGVLRNTERLGLQVMMTNADIIPARLTEEDIGFSIGPRLNALGRLDDANMAVEFLTTDDLERARVLANQLEALNAQRRMISKQVTEAAEQQIQRDPSLLDYAVLLLGHESWPSGVVGIVANRLAEQYNRPVVLLVTPPNEPAHGSARSVAGCDITAAIAQHAELLNGYGGHTMAAGMSLPAENIPAFRNRLSRTVAEMLGKADTTPTLSVDAYVDLSEISMDLLETVQRLAPFGPGNPALTLATRRVTLVKHVWMGRNDEHLRLTVQDEQGDSHDVVWWRADFDTLPKGRFDLAYTIHANEYQGKRNVQLQFVAARPVDEAPLTFKQRESVEVVDWRRESDPVDLVTQLGDDVLVWAEGQPSTTKITSAQRVNLERADTLVIWSAPPDAETLQNALDAVNPGKVYLVAQDTTTDSVQGFLQRFGGVIKHVLNSHENEAHLKKLAGFVGHRESTVLAGLEWLQVHGHVDYALQGENIYLSDGTHQSQNPERAAATTKLAALLQETAAYRSYFRRADADTLIQV